MIKIRVANMSCGHCRLKINAELVEAGFKGNEFDMDKDTINIDATLQNLNEAYKAINKIGYIIDKDFRPIISEKITLEVNDLHNKDILDKVVDILFNFGIVDIDFNLDTDELFIITTNSNKEALIIKLESENIKINNV